MRNDDVRLRIGAKLSLELPLFSWDIVGDDYYLWMRNDKRSLVTIKRQGPGNARRFAFGNAPPTARLPVSTLVCAHESGGMDAAMAVARVLLNISTNTVDV